MKVIEHIEQAKNPLFSYEIVPPPRGHSVKEVTNVVQALLPLNPPWIDVTSHSSTALYHEKADGTVERRIVKKRPGTMGICGIIQNRFKIDTVAHVLCLGFTREETEDALIELSYLGIHNVLALRGDVLNYQKVQRKDRTINFYASDLVSQLNDIREGKYLQDMSDTIPIDFCVGVAGYPEKHFEAPNLKTDIELTKKKVDAGAHYIASQMFFDNNKFFAYEKSCREAGITVPIIPGLKVLKTAGQLTSLPKNFYIDIPDELAEEVKKNPQHASEIGENWAYQQTVSLLENGAKVVHFYIMNNADQVVRIVKKVQKL